MLFQDHGGEECYHTLVIFFVPSVKCVKVLFAEVFSDEEHSGIFISDKEVVEDFPPGSSVSVIERVDAFKSVVEEYGLFKGTVSFRYFLIVFVDDCLKAFFDYVCRRELTVISNDANGVGSAEHTGHFDVDVGHDELVDFPDEFNGDGFFVGVTILFDEFEVLDFVDFTQEFVVGSNIIVEKMFCLAKVKGVSFDGGGSVDILVFAVLFIFFKFVRGEGVL